MSQLREDEASLESSDSGFSSIQLLAVLDEASAYRGVPSASLSLHTQILISLRNIVTDTSRGKKKSLTKYLSTSWPSQVDT